MRAFLTIALPKELEFPAIHYLSERDVSITMCASIAEATRALIRDSYQLIYYESSGLYEQDVIREIKTLREMSLSPLIAMIPKEHIEDALSAGADMCFAIGYNRQIICAHAFALLRRYEVYDQYDRIRNRPVTLHRGDLEIDLRRRIVKRNGQEIALHGREYRLLSYFAENPKTVHKAADLSAAVWNDDQYEMVVAKAVSELRRKLGDSSKAPKYIETVRRSGYRFLFDR